MDTDLTYRKWAKAGATQPVQLDYLGFRWLWQGPVDGSEVPKDASITFYSSSKRGVFKRSRAGG